jgi:glycosyltransferase involved in cell wall biosynthesis
MRQQNLKSSRGYYSQLEEERSTKEYQQRFLATDLTVEIIIPTLNEELTIKELIEGIRSCVLPLKVSILVVDGGSTDHTLDICKKDNVKFIVQKERGKGSAIREAVANSAADIVVFIDADGTYSFSDLELLLEPLLNNKADIIVGSRVQGKRQKRSISILNTFGNKLFNKTINFAMKSSLTDCLSGYRALFRNTFNDLVLFSDNFEIEVEMTVEALAKGYRVLEVPINYKPRKDGSNTKLDPLGDGMKIGRTLLFILMNVSPLKFFGIFSTGFFVIALWPTAQVLYEKIVHGEIISIPAVVLSALLLIAGALCMAVGMVSELVVRSRRRLEFLINKKLR